MASTASIMGHPIHPMLIPFPIALWIFSLVTDIIYLIRDNNGHTNWTTISKWSLLAGCIGAVAAAIFGIIDWLSIKDRAVKKIADWHARLNIIALLIFAASWYLRTDKGQEMLDYSLKIPMALSALGVILIIISGWLGGELVYKHGVAVNPQHDTIAEEAAKARIS